VTHERALRDVLPAPAAYIGVIGSQRKIDTIVEHLRTDGFTDDQPARVRAPIGMHLGGREMAQIALAIMAEIEVVRHGGSRQPRSEGMKIILCNSSAPPPLRGVGEP